MTTTARRCLSQRRACVPWRRSKRYGLQRGDRYVRAARDNDQSSAHRRDQDNPLVRDTINRIDPVPARHRPEFHKLTPVCPRERLRLETEPNVLRTGVVDLVMPIGKGQQALIVSPPKDR